MAQLIETYDYPDPRLFPPVESESKELPGIRNWDDAYNVCIALAVVIDSYCEKLKRPLVKSVCAVVDEAFRGNMDAGIRPELKTWKDVIRFWKNLEADYTTTKFEFSKKEHHV